MKPAPEDIAARYAGMSEIELMELAQEYDSLTDAAQSALRTEFAKRKLDPPIIGERVEAPQPEARRLVTVGRYRDLAEAIVARSLLEAEEIGAWVQDENLVRLDWMYANAVGGIRLQVETTDVGAATEILAQLPASIPYAEGTEYIQPQCPQCGSPDISLVPMSPTWRCNGCGTQGQIVEDDEEAPSTADD